MHALFSVSVMSVCHVTSGWIYCARLSTSSSCRPIVLPCWGREVIN